MRKFSLFSKTALTSMAAAAAATTGGAPRENDDDNPEAGPVPEDDDKPAPVAKPADAGSVDGDEGAEAGTQVVTFADATAHGTEQFAAGRKAERERTAAVFGSDIGKANPSMAAWLLSTGADASAEAIITQLTGMPGASAAAPAPAPAAGGIPDTNVDLGNASGAAAAVAEGAGDKSGDDIWADVQGKNTAPVVSSDAGRSTIAALQSGARTVTVSGTVPSAPAVPATGN